MGGGRCAGGEDSNDRMRLQVHFRTKLSLHRARPRAGHVFAHMLRKGGGPHMLCVKGVPGVVPLGMVGWHCLSNATWLMRPHVFSTA